VLGIERAACVMTSVPAATIPETVGVIRSDEKSAPSAIRPQLHLDQIDPLRGAAILGVLLYHALGASYLHFQLPWKGQWRTTSPDWTLNLLFPFTFGWAGVSLFFVISGFVIHHSTLRRSEFSRSQFAARRFWRIYPPYVIAVLFFVALNGGSVGGKSLLAHLLLLHNASDAWIYDINPSFWSLATECQLYALYPLLWSVRQRWGAGGMLAVSAFVSCVTRVAAEIVYPGELPLWITLAAPTLWFDWTLGAYLCDSFVHGRTVFSKPKTLAAAFALATVLASLYRPTSRHVWPLASLASAAWLEHALRTQRSAGVTARTMAILGMCSYSVYLFHQPLMQPLASAVYPGVFSSRLLLFAVVSTVFVFLSLTAGPVLYRTIEQPFQRFGNRLAKQSTRHP
jgi:peptidoglycan/LPS O-acetylase OafA/YrhL